MSESLATEAAEVDGGCNDDWQESQRFVQLIGGRWVLPVLRELSDHPARFQDLLRSLHGVSRKVLTETLRRAERDGLIRRRIDVAHIETATLYELTELGRSVGSPLTAVASWIEAHWDAVQAARSDWQHREET